jgi:hypothetical protein
MTSWMKPTASDETTGTVGSPKDGPSMPDSPWMSVATGPDSPPPA